MVGFLIAFKITIDMREITYEAKSQACNLCDALHRNIDDSFHSISFEIRKNGMIQVKVILTIYTVNYKEIIEDISTEFSALQESNCVLPFIVVLASADQNPLPHVVFRKRETMPREE